MRNKAFFSKKTSPLFVYDPALPIIQKKDEIIKAISLHPVVIVSGETGSGKTTQLPKFCLEAGRGVSGIIGCTQPRRIAAMSVAARISEELGEILGSSVGYKIRFKDRTSRHSIIKIMTDGILLAETLNDPNLGQYDTIIVDEAHERSLNIDFILGIIKTILKKRHDLRLIITSATIDTDKFSKAFDDAPVIEVSGRMYPVEVRYLAPFEPDNEEDEPSPAELAVKAIEELDRNNSFGDILVFMPTEQDIRETCELIEGRKDPGTAVLPLFARLSSGDQSRVFSPAPGRKIIVATNIAETSLTIPGIKYVIDTGLARISQYTPRARTTSLQVRPISKSSADQRQGRCGRMENGICIRLYSEENYLSRPLYSRPEILRSNLAEVILKMMALKLGSIYDFPFIDMPDSRSIKDGFDLLIELGAIYRLDTGDKKFPGRNNMGEDSKNDIFRLTEQGKIMSKIPADPRLSRIMLESMKEGCLSEILIIAAALCIQDPRERPADKVQQADSQHRIFSDPSSDFIWFLNLWKHYQQITGKSGELKRFCKQHFLSFRRIREWQDIHAQFSESIEELATHSNEKNDSIKHEGTTLSTHILKKKVLDSSSNFADGYSRIHRAILSGFLSNIAVKKEKNIFKATRGRELMIFPGSCIFNKAGKWIVAAEMIETSRLFARTAAGIDPEWLEELGKRLCRYNWSQAHWQRSRGEVVAFEQASLFGLVIVEQRPVSYGRINNVESSNIFIRSALVDGDVKKPFPFMIKNQKLIDEIKDVENRFRRKDILVGEHELYEFYRERIPFSIYDIRTFQRFIKDKGGDEFLCMKDEDILRYIPDPQELALYPDKLEFGNNQFSCLYNFSPGSKDDGITLEIPVNAARTIPGESLEWGVPGLFREKIEALLKALPKKYRKQLVPVSKTADIITSEIPKGKGLLADALSKFIQKRLKINIPSSAWSAESLPDHLKMRIVIQGPEGKVIYEGRDVSALRNHPTETITPKALETERKKWEQFKMTSWEMETIPESIRITGEDGISRMLFPCLLKNSDGSVDLRVFEDEKEAITAHCLGVAALFEILYAKELRFLQKFLVIPNNKVKMAEHFGGVKKLQKKFYNAVINRLFARNIRSKSDFLCHAEKTLPEMAFIAGDFMNGFLDVMEAFADASTVIKNLVDNNPSNLAAKKFWKELVDQLNALIPEDFMMKYEKHRFHHIIRYSRAIAIRAQRAWLDFEKDRLKTDEIRLLSEKLCLIQQKLSPFAGEEEKKAVDELFWMIEEYKVSVYAQELKTAIPVSRKRIEKAFESHLN